MLALLGYFWGPIPWALKKQPAMRARALRDGMWQEVDAKLLVPDIAQVELRRRRELMDRSIFPLIVEYLGQRERSLRARTIHTAAGIITPSGVMC